MPPDIPPTKTTDVEDVIWGLQTADTLWRRGERIDALVWLRRAAQAAGDANDDDRALELARFAAELTEWMANEASSEAEAEDSTMGDDVEHLDADDVEHLDDDDLEPEEDEVTGTHHKKDFQELAASMAASMASDLQVAASAPAEPNAVDGEKRPSVPPAEKVHAGMFDPWAEQAPQIDVAEDAGIDIAIDTGPVEEVEEEVVTSVRPQSISRPDRDPSAGPHVRIAPEPPTITVPIAPAPVAPPPAPQRPSRPNMPAVAPLKGAPPPPPLRPLPKPSSPRVPVAAPVVPQFEAESEAEEDMERLSLSDVVSEVSTESMDDLEGRLQSAPVVPVAPPVIIAPPVVHEDHSEDASEVLSLRDVDLSSIAEDVSIREMEVVEPAKPAAAAPLEKLSLEDVEAFADLPDDARESFAAAGELHPLAEGEEIGTFALAFIVKGAFDVAATVVDAPAMRLPAGSVIRAKGTTEENVPVRLISTSKDGVVAVWSDDDVEKAFTSIPWVEDDLRAAADRIQTLVGITIGPLGERLDISIREQIVSRLTMRPLDPSEIVASAGEPVPGLLLVGIGELELVKGEEVVGQVGSGEFLFPTEVLGHGNSPFTARSGKGGALIMFGDRGVAQELMVTCPPLLEVFAGM